MREGLRGARAAAHEVAEEKDAEIAYLKGKVDSLAAKVPSADDLTDCIQMARDSAYGYREKMEERRFRCGTG